ncbi:hypothetical protein [Mesorhizobium sp. B2-4-6]|uniref:hypothetical protein n=1 Tax=Mesorhizobium sp. B2-4-6 TaxID=2589943 RepID=UPI0015E2EFB8|nr:hypothetical protein [Mesorhizobium sp. B2-4-6]
MLSAIGSGKTSLLEQIAGWIGDDAFAAGDCILSASERRAPPLRGARTMELRS